ncbi:unnamed protein product [Anisakis simplex]|uniref:G_PROTEIN_RECEP_F1_2 domain-containing protein n=1 Tax=Anisakis simplex TaxID=6269 RepID=A0A0M3K1W7_ANISI|nr:unnamed protein product [Anisakis simplex]
MLIWSDDVDNRMNDTDMINEITFSTRIFTTYSFTLSYMLPLVAIWFFYANIIARLWARRNVFFKINAKSSRRTTTKAAQTYCRRNIMMGVVQAKLISNLAWCTAAVVGVPGNILVLYVIMKYREMRTVSNVFIFNLALADLLFLCGVPIVSIQTITSEWIFGQAMCKAFISENGINQFARAIFMGVLSLDRYLAVCYAVQSTKWRTPRFAFIISLASWLAVTIEMVPLLKFAKLIKIYEDGSNDSRCACMLIWSDDVDNRMNDTDMINEITFSTRIFTTYSFTLSYMLPLVAIWFFYANIIARLWARRNVFFKINAKSSRRTTTKVTLMGLTIVISYTLFWMPFWIVTWSIVLEAKWAVSPLLEPLSYSSYALQYINSAVNPFLYMFLTDTFRQKLGNWRSTRCRLELQRQPSEKTHMLLSTSNTLALNAKLNETFRGSDKSLNNATAAATTTLDDDDSLARDDYFL